MISAMYTFTDKFCNICCCYYIVNSSYGYLIGLKPFFENILEILITQSANYNFKLGKIEPMWGQIENKKTWKHLKNTGNWNL